MIDFFKTKQGLVALFISLILFIIIAEYGLSRYVNIPFSDSWHVVDRYMKLQNGETNLVDFMLRRHGDHSHASVYALSYLDIKFFDFRVNSLHYLSIIFVGLVFVLLLIPILKNETIPTTIKALLTVFVAVFTFNTNASEVLALPFQVVVSSSRVLFIATLLLAIYSTKSISNKNLLFGASLLFAIPTSVAHGSGFIIFLSIMLVMLVTRNIRFFILTAILFFAFLAFTFFFQTTNSNLSSKHIYEALSNDFFNILKHGIVYLGAGLVRHTQYMFITGLFGVFTSFILLGILLFLAIKKHNFSSLLLFFGVYLIVSGLTGPMASTLHHSLSHVGRHYYTLNDHFFTANRYFYNASSFWISIVMVITALTYELGKFKKITLEYSALKLDLNKYLNYWEFIVVFPKKFVDYKMILFISIFVAVVTIQNFYVYGNGRLPYVALMQESRACLKSNVLDFSILERIAPPWMLEKIAYLQKNHLSLFSEPDYNKKGATLNIKNAKEGIIYGIDPIRKDQHKLDGFSYGNRVYGFFPQKVDLSNSNHTIYLTDENDKLIGFASQSEKLYVTAVNFDNAAYFAHNPDVATSEFAKLPYGGWQHWKTYGAQEGRIPFTNRQDVETGKLMQAATSQAFLGFVPKSYTGKAVKAYFCQQDCFTD